MISMPPAAPACLPIAHSNAAMTVPQQGPIPANANANTNNWLPLLFNPYFDPSSQQTRAGGGTRHRRGFMRLLHDDDDAAPIGAEGAAQAGLKQQPAQDSQAGRLCAVRGQQSPASGSASGASASPVLAVQQGPCSRPSRPNIANDHKSH